MKRSSLSVSLGLCVFVAVSLLLAIQVGGHWIGLGEVFSTGADSPVHRIFWHIRVPRVLTAFIAGAALSISGMAFQAIFRNPLATPFTLGVASGASLGATVFIGTGWVLGWMGLPMAAFIGALGSIMIVYGLTRLRGGFGTSTLLLAGVALSFFFSSIILFTQYLADFTQSFRIIRWLMGGLDVLGYDTLKGLLPFVVVGSTIVFLLSGELNLLSTGEELAYSRGVEVHRVKKLLFFSTSMMVGAVVAVCGPIGFVGMMVPHMCRLLWGGDHRTLSWTTALFGGTFLLWCDTFARTIIAPAEIPVGVITALLGGPFFIWLLLRGNMAESI